MDERSDGQRLIPMFVPAVKSWNSSLNAMLSLCMIVKNEAEQLPTCLASVQPQLHAETDEIIILDTGSDDDTKAIAQSFGAKVYDYTWQDDFAAARNACLEHATQDWILVLDADETLVVGSLEPLRALMANPNTLVLNLLRQEVGAAQSPYSLVSRLFRKHPALTFSRPYHAMIDDAVDALRQQEPHWQVVQVPEVMIRHGGYGATAIAAGQKFTRARRAMERFYAEHPDDLYVAAKLGALYVEQGDWGKGTTMLQTAIARLEAQPEPQPEAATQATGELDAQTCYELYYHLAIALNRQGQAEAAADYYQAAIAQPILPRLKLGAYNNLANILKNEGFAAAAQELYEEALKIDPSFATGYYNLGMVKRSQGDLQGAISAYETALYLTPEVPEIHQNLGVALLKAGLLERSQQAFERAIAIYQQQGKVDVAQQLRNQLNDLNLFQR